jgi:hypothetical protein
MWRNIVEEVSFNSDESSPFAPGSSGFVRNAHGRIHVWIRGTRHDEEQINMSRVINALQVIEPCDLELRSESQDHDLTI